MHAVKELGVFGTKHSGILELDVHGWLSRHTVDDFNAAIGCFDHRLQGAILDYRGAVIDLKPDEIHLFEKIMDCPMAYLCMPEQSALTKKLVIQRRSFGFRRTSVYSRRDAEHWLSNALGQRH